MSVSKTIAYKGQSISVDLLVTDNKEVNNLRVELVDQIGQIKDYYDGVAWPKRISGDSLIGVYRIELWVRTITYDGFWSTNASARDLNFNGSTLEEVVKVKIVDGPIPPSSNTNLNTTATSNTEVSSENPKYVYGKFDVITSEITKTVVNDVERSKLLSAVTSMVNLPSTVRSNRVLVNKDVARLVDVTVEAPKVCSFTSGIINRKIKGLCSLKISTVDSDGNTFAVTKEVRFR